MSKQYNLAGIMRSTMWTIVQLALQRVGICVTLWVLFAAPLELSAEAVVERATGSGNKVVGPVKVTDPWELRWDFDGYLMQIYVNQKDAPFPDLPIDQSTQEGSGKGSSLQENAGMFYLKVIAQGNWTITVVQLR